MRSVVTLWPSSKPGLGCLLVRVLLIKLVFGIASLLVVLVNLYLRILFRDRELR